MGKKWKKIPQEITLSGQKGIQQMLWIQNKHSPKSQCFPSGSAQKFAQALMAPIPSDYGDS